MDERLGLHAEAMGLLDAVVQHVTDEDLDRPTPCAGWTVTERELAEVPLPLRAVVDAQLLDVLAHTWDLAKGLGHDFTPPDHFTADFLRMAQEIKDRAYGEGRAFRERLKPEGSDWEQGLRLLGRYPGWAPGVS